VESEEVVRQQLADHATFMGLEKTIKSSPEYLNCKSDVDLPTFLPANLCRLPPHVDTALDERSMAALFARISDQWHKLGQTEPHWSVMTNDEFKSKSFAKNEEAFYQSGRGTATLIEAFAARSKVDVPRGSITEFGCGTGRVTMALAEMFTKVLAVDISPHHLELCRQKMEASGRRNVEYLLLESPADIAKLPETDFMFSTICLQHNPPPLIGFFLDWLLYKVRPGGAALFQVPTHTPGYHFRLQEYLVTPSRWEFEMHCYPMKEVFALLHKHGFVPQETLMDAYTGLPGSHTFFALKS
jgi:SAM-dependent methyltransferase